jgi:hypothetical protein
MRRTQINGSSNRGRLTRAGALLLTTVSIAVWTLSGPGIAVSAVDKAQEVKVVNTAQEAIPVSAQGTFQTVVTNGEGAPLPVEEVDARVPVQFSKAVGLYMDLKVKESVYVVPDGQRLVIESVTAWMELPGDDFDDLALATSHAPGADPVKHHILMQRPGDQDNGIHDILMGTHQLTAYAAPASTVYVHADRHPTSYLGFVEISVSGYLLPA